MILNNVILELIFLIIASIIILIVLHKVYNRSKKFIAICSMIMGLILIAACIGYLYSHHNFLGIDDLYALEKKSPSSFDNISIKEVDNRKVLYDQGNEEVIHYRSFDNTTYTINDYYPVYINDLDNYSLIIFSVNENTNYNNGYFYQADYEFHENEDKLFILSKKKGLFVDYRKYDFIGKYIDLNQVNVVDDTICLPILIPHEDRIEYINMILVYSNPNSSYLRLASSNHFVGFEFFIQDSSDYIIKYAVSSNKSILIQSKSQKIVYITVIIDYSGKEHSDSFISRHVDNSDILKDQLYVKQGYFITHKGSIYYVGNNLNLYYLEGRNSIFVTEIKSLDKWMNYLP